MLVLFDRKDRNNMKKMSKEMDTSCKALGAAMFMANVLIFMGVGAAYAFISGSSFYYHIPFAFLIQGLIMAMTASAAWVIFFKVGKQGFLGRYLSALAVSLALSGISLLIPAINTVTGHFLWIASGLFSILAFGTSVAALNEKEFRATGERRLWIRSVVNTNDE